ncbi:HAD family hydrolase [Anaerocolumna sp. MB42-C2]|uniref:HAD family hydrolase n=1 Tax=Anaerocolumna sp. MB42-C2 TaxID=3070997 RepID=UPI0027E16A1E|nr:HAD family hydrolase [Anaerocolumna sp. MB42-C2]WMJ85567.1 HAD family hydrolase [Anaerocolumna sp. MB42-C2]
MKQYILFDLDGTITNPKEGITKSIQYALHRMGIEVEDLDSLCKHIGPPLKYGFMEYWGFGEEEAEHGVDLYREYYSATGIYENYEYEGIKELCESLSNSGKKLIMATSKPEKFARIIMEHFHLDTYFFDICGASMDNKRCEKGDVIRYALDKNHITDLEQVVMVGDRLHDIKGAWENNIDSIGVLYGFGSREELVKAGAGKIVETVEDLKILLLED